MVLGVAEFRAAEAVSSPAELPATKVSLAGMVGARARVRRRRRRLVGRFLAVRASHVSPAGKVGARGPTVAGVHRRNQPNREESAAVLVIAVVGVGVLGGGRRWKLTASSWWREGSGIGGVLGVKAVEEDDGFRQRFLGEKGGFLARRRGRRWKSRRVVGDEKVEEGDDGFDFLGEILGEKKRKKMEAEASC
uniref:Uncharacterized protein n=1 Tax=Oryza punctata TaxID=4537 RepID=A0A0E0MGM0_ORYPU